VLRNSLASWKLEYLLFLRMNKHLIPEVAEMLRVAKEGMEQAVATARAVATVQGAVATPIEIT
jgi:hypothetical protein